LPPPVDAARPSVVAVVGSPRRNGNTATLVAAALEDLEHRGAACETIDLGRLSLAPCLAHDTCGELAACVLDDDAAESLDRVYAADCLILATPVYYENVSAQMKAFIDRNYFPYMHGRRLRAKAVGLVVVTAETGLEETLAALRRFVALSSHHDIPVSVCAGYADEAGAAAADAGLLAEARRLAGDLAAAMGLSPA
jgi:multimeric flavodoxin WrbA